MRTRLPLIAIPLLALVACRSTPEPEVPIVVVPPVQTCVPLESVEAVTIPAETEQVYVLTTIENPPYEPITRREPVTRTIREAYIVYRRPDGTDVPKADICEFDPVAPSSDTVPVMEGVGARDLSQG